MHIFRPLMFALIILCVGCLNLSVNALEQKEKNLNASSKSFLEDSINKVKTEKIDPLLEEQAVAHLDGQLKRYQQETGNRLTDADFEAVDKLLTPDKIQSGYFAKEAIRDAIRSVPIAGKTIAGGIKSAAEIPALALEIPEAIKNVFSFGGRKSVKEALGKADIMASLSQAGKFTRNLATDVTGIQEGQGFQDFPTGLGTVSGGLIAAAISLYFLLLTLNCKHLLSKINLFRINASKSLEASLFVILGWMKAFLQALKSKIPLLAKVFKNYYVVLLFYLVLLANYVPLIVIKNDFNGRFDGVDGFALGVVTYAFIKLIKHTLKNKNE